MTPGDIPIQPIQIDDDENYAHPLATQFDELGKDDRILRFSIARAKQDTCFMCELIIEKEPHSFFPLTSRKIHLMLCCDPKRESNQKWKKG